MIIALSAAKGLAYLHVAREVVHDNIKSSNIFLQQETNNEAALSDYGLNTLFHGSSSMNHKVTGSTGSGRTQLDWDNRMRIALSAAKELACLHLAEVVHGNIKSSNVLVRQETKNEAFVSDYGLNTLSNHPVTGYWAPEVPEAQKVTSESDAYSFGVLLLELLTGQTPKQQASSGKERVVNFSKWAETIVCQEPKAEIFYVELRRGHNIEEMAQLLRIAKDCVLLVPNQRPKMQDVVSMMEDVWLRPSSDDHSKGYDYTPSTETRDTPSSSTITP
ncbi:hypothetical protein L1987_50057 [Smallanthus sonchifolius]|uniref:Uncharacterized protein n=1 Tax=Smallanthus sonchifolius TaxID=185202 RepID=A0ACB9FXB4_9ASTR|nr:hypothetical protein L1987_50057 [Smallanthus sonchifolius]